MQRFKNVLVFANQSADLQPLLQDARELASRNGASLTVFDVVPSIPTRRRWTRSSDASVDVQELLVRARGEELQAEVASDEAVDVVHGTPFVEVIKKVDRDGHDLILMEPELVKGSLRGLSGATTTLHLLRKSPVPVLVDRAGSEQRPDVAVAVGPFDPEQGSPELNAMLVELGSSLATRRGGTLHVIHAWRLLGESLMRSYRSGIGDEEVELMGAETEREAAAQLKEVLDTSYRGDAPFRLHLRKGDAADLVTSIVDQHRPGVLVMGTLARSGISGLIIGNTAERVLGAVDASIMAVKPPGFVSPVLA